MCWRRWIILTHALRVKYVFCRTHMKTLWLSFVELQTNSMNSEYDRVSLEALLSSCWILILNSMNSWWFKIEETSCFLVEYLYEDLKFLNAVLKIFRLLRYLTSNFVMWLFLALYETYFELMKRDWIVSKTLS